MSKLIDPGPDEDTKSFIGEYYIKLKNPDSTYKQLDYIISYAGKNRLDIKLNSFIGAMYQDSTFDERDLKVQFSNIGVASKDVIEFSTVADGAKDGKFVYRARFKVITEKTSQGLNLYIETIRVDVPGTLWAFRYQLIKK